MDTIDSRARLRIAFLGIGLMGQPMALRLLQAGYPLTVWNRSAAKVQPLLEYGAQPASTPAQAVAHADLVLTMLADGSVVGEVIEQAWPGLRTGVLVVDMSSTRQDEAQQLQARLAQRQVRFVDAPVSGGVAGAAAGTLAIMAGAAPEDFEAARSVFDCLGRATLVGAVGCGQLAKLCNQLIVGGTLNIVAEALLLAQAGGADPAAVRAALRGGFADSRVLEVHGQRMLERDFMPGGQVKSQLKDLENTLLAARAAALKLPLTELVTARYRTLLARMPQADQAAALLALEQLNPAWRLGSGPDRLP